MSFKIPSVFKNYNFMLLWIGQSVSKLGDRFYAIAMMWYIYQLTGSPLALGISVLCNTLPTIIFSPIAGVLSDRIDKKKIIVLSDLLNGLSMVFLAYLLLSGNQSLNIIYLFIVIVASITAFFSPAITASIPLIVDDRDLPKANSLSQLSSQITNIIGPALAGVMIAFADMWLLVLINGISYLLSAFSECFIKVPKIVSKTNNEGFMANFKEGLQCTLSNKGLLLLVFAGIFINFFLAPLNVYITIITSEILTVGSTGLGIIFSLVSIGALIGTFAVLANIFKDIFKMTIFGISVQGLTLIALGLFTNNYFALLIVAAVMGFGVSIATIGIGTLYQKMIPKEKLGRVISLIGMLLSITVPLGTMFGTFILTLLPIPTTLLFSGLLVSLVAIIVSPGILRFNAKPTEIETV
ncbi:MFS transporter [Alkaliphilus peptidifermentans]|uniref:Predicted arabinose efflux permease, MFS family n=1 Tax=Alkaliphilus peptidifermentans DSM 18978 TaxID=1120976 RepID=A0A1G5J2N6_9FIRM|nr:MFS transporter [Alkaliphilus peptidifermentans]SCY82230.1 Predicted arabinose efflux permease, MFS family [Alkaliphilus peptidifermentans DSM 18978]